LDSKLQFQLQLHGVGVGAGVPKSKICGVGVGKKIGNFFGVNIGVVSVKETSTFSFID